MSQTSVANEPTNAFPGMDGDGGGHSDIMSRIVSTQQLEEVTIVSNADGTFTIDIDGDEEANTVASSNTKEEIRDALLTDLGSSDKSISAEASSTDKILIESTDEWDDDGFVATVDETGNSGVDISTSTLVAQAETLLAGLGVCTDDRAAAVGSSGKQCRLPRQATDVTANFLGVTRADTAREANAGSIYQNRSAVSIKAIGRIWVRSEDAIAENGDVYCRYADASANYGLGSFRSDADTSDAAQVPNAKCRVAADAGGLALIELK